MADYQLIGRDRWLRYGAKGMSGPTQDRNAVRKATVHYNGGNAVITYDIEQYLRVVAGMNDGYWSSRQYALGYNWGLSPGGHLIVIRGLDIRCAANGCQPANIPCTAIQVLTATPNTDMTREQADALENVWIPWLRVQYGNRLERHVIGHRDINPICADPTGTVCPGPRIYPRIQTNVLDDPGVPLPPTPTGDDPMFYYEDGTANYTVDGGMHYKTAWPAGAAAEYAKALVSVAGGVHINAAVGTATEIATRRAWIAAIPLKDATADDGAMAALAAAVNTRAPDTHLEEVEQLVRLIPTTPGGGGGTIAPTEAQVRAWVKAELDAAAGRQLNG